MQDQKQTEKILRIFLDFTEKIKKYRKSNNTYCEQDNNLPRYTHSELCEIMGVSEDWANNRKKTMLKEKQQEVLNDKEKLLNLLVFQEISKIEKLLLLDILEEHEKLISKLEKELYWRRKNNSKIQIQCHKRNRTNKKA